MFLYTESEAVDDLQAKLDYAESIADWFLEMAEGHNVRGDLEEGLKCTQIAATILSSQNRNLWSVRVESNLRFVADCLSKPNDRPRVIPPTIGEKVSCLHVLDEALPAGGLTAMALRWIRNDQLDRVHHIALLSQEAPLPGEVFRACRETGGDIHIADPNEPYLRRAVWLKELADRVANVVILHISIFDVICGAAFGTGGGPPVLLVNHAAHTFWTGVSIADLVVNCRGSDQERFWTETYRGSKCVTIPIPLQQPNFPDFNEKSASEQKRQAKKTLGIPPDSTVILTVGASFKYLPLDGLDFLEVCENILKQLPEAFLLAAGTQPETRWNTASGRVGSRIKALGTVSQSELALIHQAADVYIEGFPFGSTTALLEAGLQGLPVVLAPAQCPPPYGTDGIALDTVLERPRTVEDYKNKIIRLSKNPGERALQGEKIRNSIAKHHTGPGWKEYLEAAISALPREHSTHPGTTPVQVPGPMYQYWSTFVAKHGSPYEETLEHSVTRALLIDLRPRLTKAVQQACRDNKSVRMHRTIPLPILAFLCNVVLPALPRAWALITFRFFSFIFRRFLLERLWKKMIILLGGTTGSRAWYEQFRNVRNS
jgi:glycosyltransferase involved in cell wall biosynthesis